MLSTLGITNTGLSGIGQWCPTKLQDVLMGFIHIANELLKEAIGKSFLNGRCVQLQVLESSRAAKTKYGNQFLQRLLEGTILLKKSIW